MSKSKSQMLLEKFHESELESQVISVAEKVAKLGDYSKSIGLLDNLLHHQLLKPHLLHHLLSCPRQDKKH